MSQPKGYDSRGISPEPPHLRPCRIALILLLHFCVAAFSPAFAQTAGDAQIESEIRLLDRQIFLELVKLAEFNVRYQQAVNHTPRWRSVFYPVAQEAAYGCYMGYTINDMALRSKGWNNPRLISQTLTKRGLASATVGSVLGGSSSLLQLAADGADAMHQKRIGYACGDSVSQVEATVHRVDEMLMRRHRMFSGSTVVGRTKELLALKEELLTYEKDRLAFEFKRWNSHSRGYFWYRNAFYIVNSSVNFARFGAVMCGYQSFGNKRYGGALGPILTASACVAGLGPFISSHAGSWIERRQMQSLQKRLPVSTLLSDEEARKKFERLADLLENSETNNEYGPIAAELVRLREEKVGLDKLIFSEERNIQRRAKVAGQQARVAPTLSMFGAASGILSTVNYYAYRQRPLTGMRLSMAGDTATLTAETGGVLATPAAFLLAYRYERNLKNKGEHPDQLLAKRLTDLQKLESIIQTAPR